MSKISRIILAVGSLALIAAFFLPIWFIFLLAPQYPEGLTMQIWLDKITGQVDIINGLNHYIGMKKISVEMFPEFGYLVYILGFYILLGLLVAIIGKRKILFAYLILLVAGGVAAMVDFYRWGYDYGHDLDPTAAIQIPGFSYQPPLFGHKTLLNFDAYSYPDIGGWLIIGVAAVFFVVWFFEWRKSRKAKKSSRSITKKMAASAAALLVISLASCTVKPEPINYGKDNCNECSMTIMDPKFAGEVITKKGKVYKFDDISCLVKFLKSSEVKQADIAQTVFTDYENSKEFVGNDAATFVKSDQLNSPMNGNTAAFSNKETAEKKAQETGGQILQWKQVLGTQ